MSCIPINRPRACYAQGKFRKEEKKCLTTLDHIGRQIVVGVLHARRVRDE